MSLGVIKSYPENPNVYKVQIAAAYSGVKVDFQSFDIMKERDEAFWQRFPFGKVPVFEGKEANLFESSAITLYVLAQQKDSPLLGKTPLEQAEIQQWVLFSENEISQHVSGWVAPLLGYAQYIKPNVESSIQKLQRSLSALNKSLESKTYLVGEDVTYADIVMVCSLVRPFNLLCDKEFRAPYKNVIRYFNTLVNKPHFKSVIGDFKYCEKALKNVPPKQDNKKEEKPKKKAAAPPPPPADDTPKPTPKPKSALDLLPKSSFVLDDWKRTYSNNDTDVAMKWFWEHFDPQGWSIWKATYKYNDELTLVFMSNNLIGGFFARLERARKYAFASMVVTGTNNNNAISGYFIIRGQEVPYEIYDAADYDSYEFVKVEPSQYEEKKDEIYKYMAWEVDGFADGKIFK
ncbi:hypothetical protein O0I10_011906 [Lichtheimia ornata]|uniref:Elongation factor 1-gamma n=1 Tax=Lichtheimia ornata TaxID=688661 RepID=A0AAD7UTH3_9FUNG|nr:uncharacterized protein O0I10_011906 [Lichtheimia ornata]KAJ8652439.1 hypothetical protein O0I10_011906 [Lichtheimia ornata]